jgi:hypothetical protein
LNSACGFASNFFRRVSSTRFEKGEGQSGLPRFFLLGAEIQNRKLKLEKQQRESENAELKTKN